jgi:hypothetical protein
MLPEIDRTHLIFLIEMNPESSTNMFISFGFSESEIFLQFNLIALNIWYPPVQKISMDQGRLHLEINSKILCRMVGPQDFVLNNHDTG